MHASVRRRVFIQLRTLTTEPNSTAAKTFGNGTLVLEATVHVARSLRKRSASCYHPPFSPHVGFLQQHMIHSQDPCLSQPAPFGDNHTMCDGSPDGRLDAEGSGEKRENYWTDNYLARVKPKPVWMMTNHCDVISAVRCRRTARQVEIANRTILPFAATGDGAAQIVRSCAHRTSVATRRSQQT
jgi:hypothetical protein